MCINKTKRMIMGNFILLEPSPQYLFNICPNAGFMLVQCCSMSVKCCFDFSSYDVKVLVHFRAFAAYYTSIVKFQKIWEKRYKVVPIAKTRQSHSYPQCRNIHTLDVSNNYWIRGATDKYDQLVITGMSVYHYHSSNTR